MRESVQATTACVCCNIQILMDVVLHRLSLLCRATCKQNLIISSSPQTTFDTPNKYYLKFQKTFQTLFTNTWNLLFKVLDIFLVSQPHKSTNLTVFTNILVCVLFPVCRILHIIYRSCEKVLYVVLITPTKSSSSSVSPSPSTMLPKYLNLSTLSTISPYISNASCPLQILLNFLV